MLAALGATWGLVALNGLAAPLYEALSTANASPAMHLGAAALVAEFGIGLPLILVIWLKKLDLRATLGLARPRLVPTLWALLMIVGGGLLLDELMFRAVQIAPWLRTGGLDQVGRAIAGASPVETALLLLPLALGPAIFEEALCRGIFLRGLLDRFRRDGGWTAIVLSSAFFGALHLDRLHAPVAATMGLLLGVIAVRTGNIWAPALCHLLNNSVSLLTPALGGPSLSNVLDQGHSTWVVVLGTCALGIGLIGLVKSTKTSSIGSGSMWLEDQEEDGAAESDNGQEEGAEQRAGVLLGHQDPKDQR